MWGCRRLLRGGTALIPRGAGVLNFECGSWGILASWYLWEGAQLPLQRVGREGLLSGSCDAGVNRARLRRVSMVADRVAPGLMSFAITVLRHGKSVALLFRAMRLYGSVLRRGVLAKVGNNLYFNFV